MNKGLILGNVFVNNEGFSLFTGNSVQYCNRVESSRCVLTFKMIVNSFFFLIYGRLRAKADAILEKTDATKSILDIDLKYINLLS